MVTAALLAFIALLQTYGQARAQRYKDLADAEISRISAGVNSIGSEVKQQGTELGRISAEVNSIGSGVDRIGSGVSRLAAYLTAEDEEENGS